MGLLLYVILGTLISSVLSLIPALHIYNVAGIILIISISFKSLIPTEALPVFMMSMIVTYSFLNTIPSLFLGAPDDSTIFVVLPGQKYMLEKRGYEAAMLTAIGGLAGIALLVLVTPFSFYVFPKVLRILSPHMFWILGLVIVYMVMTEWPKGMEREKTRLGKFWDAWRSLAAGILTLILSGLLGIIIMSKSLLPLEISFQSVMPAFVGLFAVPWIITNIISNTEIPSQFISKSVDLNGSIIARGSAAGFLGGLFAALFPIVTGGIGGLLAGHATAQRDERIFILSQGVSKTVYYVGAFLFFFVPTMHITRGGLAWMISPLYTPRNVNDYYIALGAMLLSGGIAFFLVKFYARLVIKLIERVDYQTISWYVLFILVAIVFLLTGTIGLLIMIVATWIGLIPVMFNSRRMNCMGVLLIPVTLNMAGLGPKISKFLGLIR
ncbi:MAG: tripartite tricarboxylate transporter permease [Spirochaetes bacterium]|nr:tripartite tricarboxylate transporter permease [Spirochaetota bacterium]